MKTCVPPGKDKKKTSTEIRHATELNHGRMLAKNDPEAIWGWKTSAGRHRARRRAGLITTGAGLQSGCKVLEIGCGTGMFTEMFAESGAQLIAVDISPELIFLARERGLPARQVRFMDQPFEECGVNGPYDAVVGSSVLHHLDLEPALRKIITLLKPNGRMCFAEPNFLNPQVFLERTLQFLPYYSYVSPDETAFVRWKLASVMRETGFDDIQIVPYDWLHPKTPRWLIPSVQAVGSILEKLPVVREFAGSVIINARRPK